MLAEVIFAVERPLPERPFLAYLVVVTPYMTVIRIRLVAEHTARRAVLVGCTRAMRGADPFLEREVQRLLVALPGVLGAEGLGAERALERVGGSDERRLLAPSLLQSALPAALVLALHLGLRVQAE